MKNIASGLRTLFLVHFIIGLIFGLGQLFFPGTLFGMFGVTVPDVLPYRLLGAAVLAFAASSWFGYKASVWDEVKIIVKAEIVWTVLGTLVLLYGLLFAAAPAGFWLNTVILAGFAVAFIYFYSKK